MRVDEAGQTSPIRKINVIVDTRSYTQAYSGAVLLHRSDFAIGHGNSNSYFGYQLLRLSIPKGAALNVDCVLTRLSRSTTNSGRAAVS